MKHFVIPVLIAFVIVSIIVYFVSKSDLNRCISLDKQKSTYDALSKNYLKLGKKDSSEIYRIKADSIETVICDLKIKNLKK